jgi:hypothetical protein
MKEEKEERVCNSFQRKGAKYAKKSVSGVKSSFRLSPRWERPREARERERPTPGGALGMPKYDTGPARMPVETRGMTWN